MKTLYKKTSFLRSIELSSENGTAYFNEKTPWGKKVYQVPESRISQSVEFSRTYHVPIMLVCLYLLYQGTKLVVLRIRTGHWTLYLGIFVVSLIALIGLYYAIIGRKYGAVQFQFGGESINIIMKETAYKELQHNLSKTAYEHERYQ